MPAACLHAHDTTPFCLVGFRMNRPQVEREIALILATSPVLRRQGGVKLVKDDWMTRNEPLDQG